MKRSPLWLCLVFLAMSMVGSAALAFPPYYDISEHDKAQAEARQRNLPLAWLGSYPEDLNEGKRTPGEGGTAELTQMAMAALQDRVVIIFFDGRNMAPVPAIIHAEFHKHDDAFQSSADWISPKVVFSNPEVTAILGRVSYSQMKSDREAAINTALQIIRNTPDALAPPPASSPPPAQDSAATPSPASGKSDNTMDAVSAGFSILEWLSDYGLYLVAVGVIALTGLFIWLGRSQRS